MSKNVIQAKYPFMEYMPTMKIVVDKIDLKNISPVIDSDGVITNQTVSDLELFSHITCVGKFIKLMTDNIKLISNLNGAGIKMFCIVAIMVQQESKDRAYVHMTYEQAKEVGRCLGHNITKASFYRGIDQLIENDIIAKAIVTNRFWINIGVLFNGDFSKLPEIMNADPVYLQEQGLAKIVKKRNKNQ